MIPLRVRAVRWLWVLVICALAIGCGVPAAPSPLSASIALSRAAILAAATRSPSRLLDPIALDVGTGGIALVAIRFELERGSVECRVTAGQSDVAHRIVERFGDDLVILPVRAIGARKVELTVLQSADTGPVEIAMRGVEVYLVTPSSASATARAISEAFEAETGRMADPAVENLVANADFAADDEVRGTPADWFAYAATRFDASTHTLEVVGRSTDARPFLATGPVRVEPGARYRVRWRLSVTSGAVVVRATDYDELATVFAEEPVGPQAGSVDATETFVAPMGCRAIRVRFEGAEPGVVSQFAIDAVQLERLPDR